MDLKEARWKTGLSQEEVSKILRVPKRTLQDWEDGRRIPRQGIDHWAERVAALGVLTEEGRNQILTGQWDIEYAVSIYKMQQIKKMSKWGAYENTFNANWKRVPEGFFDKLSAADLAVLVDTIKAAYDDGVTAGKKGEE